jgi:hypothetical protein
VMTEVAQFLGKLGRADGKREMVEKKDKSS